MSSEQLTAVLKKLNKAVADFGANLTAAIRPFVHAYAMAKVKDLLALRVALINAGMTGHAHQLDPTIGGWLRYATHTAPTEPVTDEPAR